MARRRHRWTALAAGLAATLLGVPVAAPAAGTAAPADAEPLIVHLDSITPAALTAILVSVRGRLAA